MKNNIRVERARKRITQQDLADVLHVTRQTINAIELGKYSPTAVLALKMSRYFELSVNELFELEESDE